jgi:hypothetical protein
MFSLNDVGFLGSVNSGFVFDPNFASVSLLLHGDGTNGSTTIVDSSPANVSVTANNGAAISTAEKQYGSGSIFFNGATQSLSFADPQLGTSNFTVEFWLKTNSSVQYAQIIGNETSAVSPFGGYSLLINNNSATGGQLAMYIAAVLVLSSTTQDWSDNAWHHIALVRSGTSFTFYTDGTANGTGTSAASMNGTNTAYIGRNNVFSPRNLVGYIDDLRITKGVARYTANFTPPAAPFPDA